jgi:hypothetical protein
LPSLRLSIAIFNLRRSPKRNRIDDPRRFPLGRLSSGKLFNSTPPRKAEQQRRLESRRIGLQTAIDLSKSRARKRVFARFDNIDDEQTNGADDGWEEINDIDDDEAGYFDDGSLETSRDPNIFMQSPGGSGIFARRHRIHMRPGASAPRPTYANSRQKQFFNWQKVVNAITGETLLDRTFENPYNCFCSPRTIPAISSDGMFSFLCR